MKKLLTLAFLTINFSLFTIHCPAQKYGQQRIDSLLTILKNDNAYRLETGKNNLPEDTNKVNLLLDLSLNYANLKNTDEGLKYANEGYLLAKKLDWKKGMTYAILRKGNNYPVLTDSANKFGSYREALQLFEELNDKEGMARAINNIGSGYSALYEYSKALEYFKKGIELSIQIGSKPIAGFAYQGTASIYFTLGNYSDALKEYFAFLKIVEETGNKVGIADALSSIASVYQNLGNYSEVLNKQLAALKIYEEIGNKAGVARSHNLIASVYQVQGDKEKALDEYFKAVKAAEEINDKENLAFMHANIASLYDQQNRYPESLKEMQIALSFAEESGGKYTIAYIYGCMGWATIRTKKIREAKEWFNKGINLAKEIGAKNHISFGYSGLASADSISGDYKSAFKNYQLHILYRDSLNNATAMEKALQTEMQYEFNKKDAVTKSEQEKKDAIALKELQKQKLVRNGFAGGFAVVLLFAGVFFRQRNKTRKEKLRAEHEKKRSDELLLNILPSEVADEIKNTGTAKAKAFTMVTVMFTDFKDFTSVSEKVSAELLVDEIHTCFSAFDHILQKHKIEKIKTIGDAYLCASGLPVSNYTHAVDMLNAAFEIRSFMLQRKREKELRGEIPFEIRIGIHTGPVVAGIVGVKKYAYDIWGDTVNLAARMEQNSEAGKINISGSTYELVKGNPIAIGVNCEYRGKISAKNKGEIDMYFVEKVL